MAKADMIRQKDCSKGCSSSFERKDTLSYALQLLVSGHYQTKVAKMLKMHALGLG